MKLKELIEATRRSNFIQPAALAHDHVRAARALFLRLQLGRATFLHVPVESFLAQSPSTENGKVKYPLSKNKRRLPQSM